MKLSFITLSIAALLLCSSCDSLRRLVGRPTSADIERKRAEIVSRQQLESMRKLDSIDALKKFAENQVETEEAAEAEVLPQEDPQVVADIQSKAIVLNSSQLGGFLSSNLKMRYYVVVGAFADKLNAEKLLLQAKEKDFDGVIVTFKNGLNAVCICPSNYIDKAFERLEKLKNESFCPEDVWILVNE